MARRANGRHVPDRGFRLVSRRRLAAREPTRSSCATCPSAWAQRSYALEQQAASLVDVGFEEAKQFNEELHRRQIELERAMTARSRFYASMSHELRTPINAVLGYSTLLLESIYGPLNEKQDEGLERTQKAARHLLELVNDVLDMSKIEAGKIDLRLQSVEFPALIEDLLATVRPLADEQGTTITRRKRWLDPTRWSRIHAAGGKSCSTCYRTPSSSGAANRSSVGLHPRRRRRRADRRQGSGRRHLPRKTRSGSSRSSCSSGRRSPGWHRPRGCRFPAGWLNCSAARSP